jgi:hypothetical protein
LEEAVDHRDKAQRHHLMAFLVLAEDMADQEPAALVLMDLPAEVAVAERTMVVHQVVVPLVKATAAEIHGMVVLLVAVAVAKVVAEEMLLAEVMRAELPAPVTLGLMEQHMQEAELALRVQNNQRQ